MLLLRMSRSGSATNRLSGSRASGPREASAFSAARRTLGSGLFTFSDSCVIVCASWPRAHAIAGAATTITSADSTSRRRPRRARRRRSSRRERISEAPCEERTDGQPDPAAGVVDPLETGAEQHRRGAELRLVAQSELGADRDVSEMSRLMPRSPPKMNNVELLEVVESFERQPHLQHPDGGIDLILEPDPGHSGDIDFRSDPRVGSSSGDRLRGRGPRCC